MSAKKSIPLLVVCALLSFPGLARASDIDIQTDGARLRIGASSGINIESRGIATNHPNQWRSPIYHRRNLGLRNCNWENLNQRTRSSNFSSGVTRTYSSTSTMVCR